MKFNVFLMYLFLIVGTCCLFLNALFSTISNDVFLYNINLSSVNFWIIGYLSCSVFLMILYKTGKMQYLKGNLLTEEIRYLIGSEDVIFKMCENSSYFTFIIDNDNCSVILDGKGKIENIIKNITGESIYDRGY